MQRCVPYTQTLAREINRGLSEFKLDYNKYLGQSLSSHLIENDPAGNLAELAMEVDSALQDIHNTGDTDHPLWDVQWGMFVLDYYTL